MRNVDLSCNSLNLGRIYCWFKVFQQQPSKGVESIDGQIGPAASGIAKKGQIEGAAAGVPSG